MSRKLVPFLFFLLLLACLATGCGMPAHIALEPSDITEVTKTDVRAAVPQEEVTMVVPKSTVGANMAAVPGGVCCMLFGSALDKGIDKANSEKAQAWIAPLLEQTPDVDFRKDYWDALLPTLRALPWIKVGETELTAIDEDPPKEWFDNDVLLVVSNYELTPDGKILAVGSRVQYWIDAKPKSRPSYYAFHTYLSEAVGGEDEDACMALWAANGAELYRIALQEGVQETMRMIRLDLPDAQGGTDHMTSGVRAVVKAPTTLGKSMDYRGEIVDRGESRILFRNKDDNLFSWAIADLEIDEK